MLIWKIKFSIKPSLSKSEEIDGYYFRVKSSGETIVEKTYETSSFDELHPERAGEYEYAEETLARLDAETIRELLLKRMIYQRNFSPITIKMVESPVLINRDALGKSGVKFKRHIGFSFTSINSILDVDDSLTESMNFWNDGFKNSSVSRERDVIRISDWLERSENEREHYQFVNKK